MRVELYRTLSVVWGSLELKGISLRMAIWKKTYPTIAELQLTRETCQQFSLIHQTSDLLAKRLCSLSKVAAFSSKHRLVRLREASYRGLIEAPVCTRARARVILCVRPCVRYILRTKVKQS